MQINGAQKGRLAGMRVNPAQSDQIMLFLVLKNGFFPGGCAGIRRAGLLGNEQMCDLKAILSQFPREHTAGFDVIRSVSLGYGHEFGQEHVGHNQFS